jgi:hypothetical protein
VSIAVGVEFSGKGINVFADGKDPEIGPIESYPSWLFELETVSKENPSPEDQPKRYIKVRNRAAIREANLLSSSG